MTHVEWHSRKCKFSQKLLKRLNHHSIILYSYFNKCKSTIYFITKIQSVIDFFLKQFTNLNLFLLKCIEF